jgi:NDP-4-keto-2,6-dideoxyhexose 3-C-methyltransferase
MSKQTNRTFFAERSSCRSCGSKHLKPVLSLGEQYVSNFVDDGMDLREIPKAPLELVLCERKKGGCGLLQLKHTVSPDLMYRKYWYRSGINRSMTMALEDIARSAERVVALGGGDVVVDIGCNDGTLLRSYRTSGLKLVGFEPASNLITYAEKGTTKIVNDYFNLNAYRSNFGASKAKVVTSIAMFYDLEDPNTFVRDVAACLDKNGAWVIQMAYLPSMLTQNAFDNVCSEHLEYYALEPLRRLLERHDLDVFDVELNDVNGGSFRVYIKHKAGSSLGDNEAARKRVAERLRSEEDMRLDEARPYDEFAGRVKGLRDKLHDFIKREHDTGKRIYVYGASTKGNTLLQYCALDRRLIGAAAERNQDKWGRVTVGTLIPIISEDQARAERPDYFLVLPWHFLNEFMEREQSYLKSGGRFIVPLPQFKVI